MGFDTPTLKPSRNNSFGLAPASSKARTTASSASGDRGFSIRRHPDDDQNVSAFKGNGLSCGSNPVASNARIPEACSSSRKMGLAALKRSLRRSIPLTAAQRRKSSGVAAAYQCIVALGRTAWLQSETSTPAPVDSLGFDVRGVVAVSGPQLTRAKPTTTSQVIAGCLSTLSGKISLPQEQIRRTLCALHWLSKPSRFAAIASCSLRSMAKTLGQFMVLIDWSRLRRMSSTDTSALLNRGQLLMTDTGH